MGYLLARPLGTTTVIKLSVNKVKSSLCAAVALAMTSLSATAQPLGATAERLDATAQPLGATAQALGDAAQPMTTQAQPSPATGAASAPEEPPTAFVAQRGSLSLAQATSIAQSRFRGRVVRAETVQQGGRTIHEIRILGDDGRVRTVRVDAETGAVM